MVEDEQNMTNDKQQIMNNKWQTANNMQPNKHMKKFQRANIPQNNRKFINFWKKHDYNCQFFIEHIKIDQNFGCIRTNDIHSHSPLCSIHSYFSSLTL